MVRGCAVRRSSRGRDCSGGPLRQALFDAYRSPGCLGDRGVARGTERGESRRGRAAADQDRRGELPQGELGQCAMGGEFGQERGFVAVEDTGRGGDAHPSVTSCGVGDEIGQRLWQGCGGADCQVGCDVVRGAAGVQGPADTAGTEAPHRRRATGLPVGHRIQQCCESRGRGAGDDGGEVGADPGRRGRGGQQPPGCDVEFFVGVGRQVGTERGQRTPCQHAQQFAFADHGAERCRVLGRGVVGERTVPGHERPQLRSDLHALSCREPRCRGEQPVAGLQTAAAVRRTGERGKRLVVFVARPGGGERQVPPCPEQYGELFCGLLLGPGVVRLGGRYAIAVASQQSGGVRGLQGDAYDGVVRLGGLAEPGQFTRADPARLQPGRWSGRARRKDGGGMGRERGGGRRGLPLHLRGGDGHQLRDGRQRFERSVPIGAPQSQGHLDRHPDGPVPVTVLEQKPAVECPAGAWLEVVVRSPERDEQ